MTHSPDRHELIRAVWRDSIAHCAIHRVVHPAVHHVGVTLLPSLVLALVVILGLLFAPGAQALGLGPIQSQSALGQPLRLSIPVSTDSSEDLGCVRVGTGDDDLPLPSKMRSALVQKNQTYLLEISTRQSINEPAISLNVMVGCVVTVARQYVVLLDPPQTAELALAAPAAVDASLPDAVAARASATGSGTSAAINKILSKPNKATTRRNRHTRYSPLPSSAETEPVPTLRPARARAATSLNPAPRTAAPAAQADHLVLSTRVEGSGLRPGTVLSPQQPAPSPEQMIPLQPGQTQPAVSLSDQDPVALMAAREADLNQRIQRLTEQAGGLQKKIDALTLQNQSLQNLQQSTRPSWLVWLLGILALLALTLGAWFAWRYRVLRQTLAGQPWWTARPEPEPEEIATAIGAELQSTTRPHTSPAARPQEPTVTRIAKNAAGKPVRPSIQARLDKQSLNPLGNSTSATDIGGLSPSAHAVELTEHEGFDATRSSFERLVSASQIQSTVTTPVTNNADKSSVPARKTEAGTKQKISPKNDQEPIDFMLDITTSGLTRPVNNALDFSLTTNVQAPPAESPQPGSMREATESFFMGMTTEPGVRDETKPVAQPQKNSDASTSTPGANPHFLQDEDELDAIATEPLQALKLDQASLHVRLVQFTSLLEQIEEMIRRNDTLHAIELLRRYVLHEPDMPTLLWLLLLEQYRKTGKKAVYESFTLHFTKRFGRAAPHWNQALSDLTPQLTLAEMPEIDDGLKVLWGTQKGLEMIERLVCGPGESDAIVFNANLQRELLQLAPMYPLDKMTKI